MADLDPSQATRSALDAATLARWRLILGKSAEAHQITCGDNAEAQRVEELVGFLFTDCEGQGGLLDQPQRLGGKRHSGGGASRMSIPHWVDQVKELFPRQAKEVMERELVQRRGVAQLLNQPDLLEKVEPNLDLVKTLLTHRHLLNEQTRPLARKIIDRVVSELKELLKTNVEQTILGAIRRDRHSPRKVYRNLDLKTTLRRNLRNYDQEREKLLVDRLYFYAAERKKRPWHVIVIVDQSGSMMDSAIYSTIMASIFYELPAMRTSLIIYDTQVVDLSDKVGQPVDVLLSVQLGGGNDTPLALRYAQELVREPARTIGILISDFIEGATERAMIEETAAMVDSGIRMIGLGALGYDCRPAYDKETAKKLRKVGMDILACTPENLAQCMARIIRG
jgi:Mg-chelatase subunit ChlD